MYVQRHFKTVHMLAVPASQGGTPPAETMPAGSELQPKRDPLVNVGEWLRAAIVARVRLAAAFDSPKR